MLGVVAQIKVKAGSESDFEAVAQQLVEQSRLEPGCLEYGLWRTETPGEYAFVERYVDAEAVEAHRKSDHFRQLGRQMGVFMEGPPTVIRLSAL
ncbi:antibiotic biosynthesis monooxygenase [Cupriavidus necator]|uniref:Antibiotic biosynthesis monooxygenase n=2 Tax=Cupriavidus necator TaxID=106590 RepID=A0A367PH23_CUPNE|nr:antibiotic biosynthesis monooxygenase [Cupriavidus necator]RCJ06854.1 antibiotic biosynthesis monooxygenase [Cupriavidus necator]